jgi:hypothetical protein
MYSQRQHLSYLIPYVTSYFKLHSRNSLINDLHDLLETA